MVKNRDFIGALSLVGALLASTFFLGTGTNLVLLAAAAFLLLVSAATRIGSMAESFHDHRVTTLLAFVLLALLTLSYQTSLSRESSFAPSWVLAALPLALLCVLTLPQRMMGIVYVAGFTFLALLAVVASYRFLALGERARLPLSDPNNFATLMYLGWIPLVFRQAFTRTTHRPDSDADEPVRAGKALSAAGYVASFFLALALFATESNAAIAIVVVALGVAWATTWARDGSSRVVALHTVIAAAAFSLYIVTSSDSATAAGNDTLAQGIGIRALMTRFAVEHLGANGLFGVGAFGFALLYGANRPLADQHTAGTFVHNDYLQVLMEGGALTLVVYLVLLAGVVRLVMRALIHSRGSALAQLGFGIALLAAAAHAAANFVVYSMPIGVLLGVFGGALVAEYGRGGGPAKAPLFARQGPGGKAAPSESRAPVMAGAGAALLAGWVFWGFLAFDTLTAGVISGQRGVPFAAGIGADAESKVAFARLAQRVNGSRSAPALTEAVWFAGRAAEPDAEVSNGRLAMQRFERAITADRWNPHPYHLYARFVEEHPDLTDEPLQLQSTLVDACLTVAPLHTPCIDQGAHILDASGRPELAFAFVRARAFPWLELLRRREPESAERYVDWMRRLADVVGDQEFHAELERTVAAIEHVKPRDQRVWWPG